MSKIITAKNNIEKLEGTFKQLFPSIPLFFIKELADWAYNYEFEYSLEEGYIIEKDLQCPDEKNKVLSKKEFIDTWVTILENKYDYSKDSFDRNMCGDKFIDTTANLIKILKSELD